MASIKPIKKGFTLIEIAVSFAIFTLAIGIAISIYFNLLYSNIKAQSIFVGVENLRIAMEKIWREIKYGTNFVVDTNTLKFQDLNCNNRSITLKNETIYIDDKDITATSIVKVKKLGFRLNTTTRPTLVTFYLNAEIISQRGTTTPINLQMSVAPINAPFPTDPCQK